MGVQVNDPAFLELVDEDAELERLGTGFTFTEGPIWNPAGYLLFSDMPGDVRRRWDAESGVTRGRPPVQQGQRDDARQRRPAGRLRARHELGRAHRPGRHGLGPRGPRHPLRGQ